MFFEKLFKKSNFGKKIDYEGVGVLMGVDSFSYVLRCEKKKSNFEFFFCFGEGEVDIGVEACFSVIRLVWRSCMHEKNISEKKLHIKSLWLKNQPPPLRLTLTRPYRYTSSLWCDIKIQRNFEKSHVQYTDLKIIFLPFKPQKSISNPFLPIISCRTCLVSPTSWNEILNISHILHTDLKIHFSSIWTSKTDFPSLFTYIFTWNISSFIKKDFSCNWCRKLRWHDLQFLTMLFLLKSEIF